MATQPLVNTVEELFVIVKLVVVKEFMECQVIGVLAVLLAPL